MKVSGYLSLSLSRAKIRLWFCSYKVEVVTERRSKKGLLSHLIALEGEATQSKK